MTSAPGTRAKRSAQNRCESNSGTRMCVLLAPGLARGGAHESGGSHHPDGCSASRSTNLGLDLCLKPPRSALGTARTAPNRLVHSPTRIRVLLAHGPRAPPPHPAISTEDCADLAVRAPLGTMFYQVSDRVRVSSSFPLTKRTPRKPNYATQERERERERERRPQGSVGKGPIASAANQDVQEGSPTCSPRTAGG